MGGALPGTKLPRHLQPGPRTVRPVHRGGSRERYNGDFGGLPRVKYWEPLNEPNLATYFMPQYNEGKPVSVDLYRNLLNRFADVVKAVDPGNLVVAGGLAPLGGTGSPSPLDFARRLLCMKGRCQPAADPAAAGDGPFRRLGPQRVHERRARPMSRWRPTTFSSVTSVRWRS